MTTENKSVDLRQNDLHPTKGTWWVDFFLKLPITSRKTGHEQHVIHQTF